MKSKTLTLFAMIGIFAFHFNTYGEVPSVCSESHLPPQKYLENRIDKLDKRYPTFLLALKLLGRLNAKTLIETGTSRNGDKNFSGDGGSTIIFGEWAASRGAILYSVDINPEAIRCAREAVLSYREHIHFACCCSIAFLENFRQPIDFLYLDSYDFDCNNPAPSQEHHLREIVAAYPFLHQNSVVMIDDCALPHQGKGKLVIEYLQSKGWIVFSRGYQVILVHEDFDF